MKYIKQYEGFFDRFKKKPKPIEKQGDYWFISSGDPTYIKLAFIKISEIISTEYPDTGQFIIDKLEYLFEQIVDDYILNVKVMPHLSSSFYLALEYYSHQWIYSSGSFRFDSRYNFRGEIKVDDFELDAENYNL